MNINLNTVQSASKKNISSKCSRSPECVSINITLQLLELKLMIIFVTD